VLGVSCDYHDAAAALVVEGEVVAAAEEERFSRVKHDRSLPRGAIASCLALADIEPDQLDAVVFHEKPLVVASRVLASRQRQGLSGLRGFTRDVPTLLGTNLQIGYRLDKHLRALGATRTIPLFFGEHHLSHSAAAFFPSPHEDAAIVTIDGVGEWATSTVGHGMQNRIEVLEEQRFPHSLGLLYSLITAWCGFEPNEGEYKLMGLAPFGVPRFRDELDRLLALDDDGSYRLDTRAVRWWAAKPERMRRLVDLLGPPRNAEEAITERDVDLARSVQELVEDALLRIARHAHDLTGEGAVCLGGGVSLNCVANGRLLREGPFDEVWVQPSPGDAGSAIGAALWFWHHERGRPRKHGHRASVAADDMAGAALGPDFDDDEVAAWLADAGVASEHIADPDQLAEEVAGRLADGAVVGWFEGRMEFGPRALGHRSILADPRVPTMQHDINMRVKGRESFRPFAPAVLWEHAAEWFEIDRPSPYMLFTFPVAEAHLRPVDEEPAGLVERVQVARSDIPACTHVDGSARVQTVHEEITPAFHRLLRAFHRRTGCPVLLNTSFNRAGEPIVCTPDDALASARTAGLDVLVIGAHIVTLGRPSPDDLELVRVPETATT
jgi:carbamoyltransferase